MKKNVFITDYIDSTAFDTFKDYARNRAKMLFRQKKRIEILNSSHRVSHKSQSTVAPGVYGEISTYGPGKLIYIRSK